MRLSGRGARYAVATRGRIAQPAAMTKLCILLGTTLGSYGFWALGDSVFGLSFLWSFLLSGVGSIVGVYAGWKLAQKLTE